MQLIKRAIIPLLLIILNLSGCSESMPLVETPELIVENTPMSQTPEETLTKVIIEIDAQAVAQTIEGFGAAGAWWAQEVGGWEEEKRKLVADLLFSREDGIGLSFYRYNIGGGDGENIEDTWRRAETFEIAPGEYDWTHDQNALWMLRAARDRGVEHYVAFVNSPPARMTVSGLTTGEKDGKSNLQPEMYAEYSQYLVDVLKHLRDIEGIPVDWISPLNEPQWNWSYKNGQEGCHYSPKEVLELTRVLLQTIQKNQLDVQVSIFESGEWKSSDVYIEKLASDPEVWEAIPHISIHSYWSSRADKERFISYFNKHHPGKPLWMSEWTEMQEGRDTGMESALVLASTIYDDLTITNVTSWQYWIAVSKYHYRDGLIYVDPLDHDILQTKRLWALGNYSRFIRPDFVRLETQGGTDTIQVSVYRSKDDQRWVLVVNNLGNQAVELEMNVKNGLLPALSEQYETSGTFNLESVQSGSSQGLSWRISPFSITTIVFDREIR